MTQFNTPGKQAISEMRGTDKDHSITQARERWGELLNTQSSLRKGTTAPADVRREPLLKTFWNQIEPLETNVWEIFGGLSIAPEMPANFYSTPSNAEIYSKLKLAIGCAPIALGQAMHYFMTGEYYGKELKPPFTSLHSLVTLYFPTHYSAWRTIKKLYPEWGKMPFTYFGSKHWHKLKKQSGKVGSNADQYVAEIISPKDISVAPYTINEYLTKYCVPFLINIGSLLESDYYHDTEDNVNSSTTGVLKMATLDEKTFKAYGFFNSVSLYVAPEISPNFGKTLPRIPIDLILRTNLDYCHPVVVGLHTATKNMPIRFNWGHAAVIDGYGFETKDSTAHYHLNMGSGGEFNGWSNNLMERLDRQGRDDPSALPYITSTLIYNIFPIQPQTNQGDPIINGEIISGRVVENKEIFPAKPLNCYVRATWNNERSYTITSTDKTGVYAMIVPSNSKIKIINDSKKDSRFESKTIQVGQSIRKGYTLFDSEESILQTIGNVWGVDFEPISPVGLLKGTKNDPYVHDDIASVLDAMHLTHTVISPDSVADLDPAELPVLFIEGRKELCDYAAANTNLIVDINQYLQRGGHIFVTGKADFFIDTLKEGRNISMYKPTRYGERLIGANTNMLQELQGDIKDCLGASNLLLNYSVPRSAHSIMNNNYNMGCVADARAYYVMRCLEFSPWGANWYFDGAYFITAYRFPYGSKGGTVQYTNYPLHATYMLNGAMGKKLVEYQVNGILARAGVISADQHPGNRDTVQRLNRSGNIDSRINRYCYTPGLGNLVLESPRQGTTLLIEDLSNFDELLIWKTDGDILLEIKGIGGSLKIPGWYGKGNRLASIRLTNNTQLSADDIEAIAVEKEPDIDITPILTARKVVPASEDETILGSSHSEILFGTPGDNIYHGKGGDNIYYYRMGEGDDTIVNERQEGCRNALRLHSDIVSGDIHVSRRGADLRLDIGNGSVTLKNWYRDEKAKIDRVEMYDGTFWDIRDLETLAAGGRLRPRRQVTDPSLLPEYTADMGEKNGPPAQTPSSGGCRTQEIEACVLLLLSGFLWRSKFMRKPM